MIGTKLYNEIINYDYGDEERTALMQNVWRDTPYVVNAYFGSFGDDRAFEIRQWCIDNFGQQNDFLRGMTGDWNIGGVTMFGYNWIGFRTKEQMEKFIETWQSENDQSKNII